MRKSKVELVQDLMQKPAGPNRDRMVQKAKAGQYHPDTTQFGSPKRQCEVDLQKARFDDLAAAVRAGNYD